MVFRTVDVSVVFRTVDVSIELSVCLSVTGAGVVVVSSNTASVVVSGTETVVEASVVCSSLSDVVLSNCFDVVNNFVSDREVVVSFNLIVVVL